MKNLFVIVSCCNVDNAKPLCYISTRSVYSNFERFQQTLQTIDSVRKKIPEVEIWLAEVSQLTTEQKQALSEKVDKLFEYCLDRIIYTQAQSPFKGPTELLVMQKVLLSNDVSMYDRIFKFSGRYVLNDNFNLENISSQEATFRLLDNGYVSTVLYCIAKPVLQEYLNDLEHALIVTSINPNLSIEAVVSKKIAHKKLIGEIGLTGNVSVDGGLVHH